MRLKTFAILFLMLIGFTRTLSAHEGPAPLGHWVLDAEGLQQDRLVARLGPNGKLLGTVNTITDELGSGAHFADHKAGVLLAEDYTAVRQQLPDRPFSIFAWVSCETRQPYGGILGVIQDNGDFEKGWQLGYDEQVFTFALATTGRDDGDGKMTYLKGKTRWQPGRLYHVAAVYDGAKMQLFVNGELEASDDSQSGDILYPDHARFALGTYWDDDEYHPHRGQIREVVLYDIAAKPAFVKHDFEHRKALAEREPLLSGTIEFTIEPYLQYATQTGITVMWETNMACRSVLTYGQTDECHQRIENDEAVTMHEVRIEGLEAETQYFYRVESPPAEARDAAAADATIAKRVASQSLVSEVSTFQTAVQDDSPFAFAIIGDTQGNPQVAGRVAEYAWNQRPHFLLHAGDLVDTGPRLSDWTNQFFPSMQPLIRRVPFFSVLGNHERNSDNYYRYVSVPAPEYYYQFQYGNATFFMIDANRNVGPDTEQYKWLQQALAECGSRWKFVCHHQPVYSSDENDYGNLWKTNKSSRGDLNVRQLVPLYEQYEVDIVFSGHIHSYERTWPIAKAKATDTGGTVYMITGGGGGSLETPGPSRPFFQNTVRRGHHYVMVRVNGGKLELHSYDIENRLFDTVTMKK